MAAIKKFLVGLFKDKKVDGRCKICGEEGTLYWTDGGKIVCSACDNPQWG